MGWVAGIGWVGLGAEDRGQLGIVFRPGMIRVSSVGVRVFQIRVSSRLLTRLSLPGIPPDFLLPVIAEANRRLAELREASHDLVLSPSRGTPRPGDAGDAWTTLWPGRFWRSH